MCSQKLFHSRNTKRAELFSEIFEHIGGGEMTGIAFGGDSCALRAGGEGGECKSKILDATGS